ncbi:MAG: transferase [Dorea sp.]
MPEFGREVAWLVERINREEKTWNLKGFIDDQQPIGTRSINTPSLLTENIKQSEKDLYVVCAVGNAKTRKRIAKVWKTPRQYTLPPSLILPLSFRRNYHRRRSILCAGTILTTNITIGKHVIINLDCTVGHDAIIEDYSTLYPSVNVSGMSTIGRGSEIGTGVNIIQGKTIAQDVIVGAGSVVVKDLLESGTYVGIPAKKRV